MRNHLLSMVLALSALGFILTASSANAQSIELPSAVSTPTGNWTHMRASSHEATSADARRQCRRNVDAGEIAIGYEGCDRLKAMIDNGEGLVVGVPDGIVFNVMNARSNGRSYSTYRVKKQLGRIDRAELYDMGEDAYGNRVYAYFFRGEDTSCNNVAWVILPPVAPPSVTFVPPPPKEKVCRLVLINEVPRTTSMTYLPGFLLSSCCPECQGPTFVPGLMLSQESGSMKTWVTVCE